MLTEIVERRVRRQHSAGFTQREMAERHGVAQRTICNWLKRIGLPAVGHGSARSKARRSEVMRDAYYVGKARAARATCPCPTLHEVAWPLMPDSDRPPPHRGYAIFGALCRAGIVFHRQPDTLVLPVGDRLVIRCPEERAWRIAGSGLDRLDVAGMRLILDGPSVRTIGPSPTLKAWCVTIKGKMEPDALSGGARDQMTRMGISEGVRIEVVGRRVIRVRDRLIVGFGVRLSGLDDRESLIVQSRGLGGKTRMGCGGFVPC